MVLKYSWGKCDHFGKNALVVTFDKDDELVDRLIKMARDKRRTISVTQIATRSSLTVIVKKVPYGEAIEMLQKASAASAIP